MTPAQKAARLEKEKQKYQAMKERAAREAKERSVTLGV